MLQTCQQRVARLHIQQAQSNISSPLSSEKKNLSLSLLNALLCSLASHKPFISAILGLACRGYLVYQGVLPEYSCLMHNGRVNQNIQGLGNKNKENNELKEDRRAQSAIDFNNMV